jgi:hypothetical protein
LQQFQVQDTAAALQCMTVIDTASVQTVTVFNHIKFVQHLTAESSRNLRTYACAMPLQVMEALAKIQAGEKFDAVSAGLQLLCCSC